MNDTFQLYLSSISTIKSIHSFVLGDSFHIESFRLFVVCALEEDHHITTGGIATVKFMVSWATSVPHEEIHTVNM